MSAWHRKGQEFSKPVSGLFVGMGRESELQFGAEQLCFYFFERWGF